MGDTLDRSDSGDETVSSLPTVTLSSSQGIWHLIGNLGSHTCVVLYDDTVKCWGKNLQGQLGLGDAEIHGDESSDMGDRLESVSFGGDIESLSIGTNTTCAIYSDSNLKCWGSNRYGQLGLGDTKDRGNLSSETPDKLPTIDLGTNRTAKAVALGTFFTCALLDNDTVKCWGRNNGGQLGVGNLEELGDDIDEMGDNLPHVDLGTNRTAVAITAGVEHACALLDNNTVKCWGANTFGKLGIGDRYHRGDGKDNNNDPFDDMGDNLPVVNLGTNRTATAIAAGYSHTCAVLDDNSVRCWGRNDDGQLGLGDQDHRGEGTDSAGDPFDDMGDNLPSINFGPDRSPVSVSTGGDHSCAILDDSSVRCWGRNNFGQLGIGSTSNQGDDPNEVVSAAPCL